MKYSINYHHPQSSYLPLTSSLHTKSYMNLPPHMTQAMHKKLKHLTLPTTTVDEIKQQRKQMPNEAAGPDNFTINIILSTCILPQFWKLHHTALIPKSSQDLHLATNWHPITISSTCVHLLHCTLACCLTKAIQLNPRQKAFILTS